MNTGGALGDGGTPSSFRLGPYTCVERLGTGPLGETFRAKIYGLAGLESQFALKRLHARLASDDRFVARLGAVVRLQARLAHEGIARIEELESEGVQRWLVGEFVHGFDLGRLLDGLAARREQLVPDLAATIVLFAARAVAYAHGRTDLLADGIVHSGLSLRSVIVTADGRIKTVNTGLLRSLAHTSWMAEAQGIGYVPYLAPEVLAEEPPQIASDVWSLGAILWALIAGGPPFSGRDGEQVLAAIEQGPLGTPRDPALGEIARRCLAVAPSQRFGSAVELAQTLEAHLGARAEEAQANLVMLAHRLITRRATGAHRVATPTPAPMTLSGSGATRWRESDPGRPSARSWMPPVLSAEEAAARASPTWTAERRSSRITGQFQVPAERRSRITLPMGMPAAGRAPSPTENRVRERRDTVPMPRPMERALPAQSPPPATRTELRPVPPPPRPPGSIVTPPPRELSPSAHRTTAPRASAPATSPQSQRVRHDMRPTGPPPAAATAPPSPSGSITWVQPDEPRPEGPPRRLTPMPPEELSRSAEQVKLPAPRLTPRPTARATPMPPPIVEPPLRPSPEARSPYRGVAPSGGDRVRPVGSRIERPRSPSPSAPEPSGAPPPPTATSPVTVVRLSKVITDLPLASLDEPAPHHPRRPPQQREPVDPSQVPRRGSVEVPAAGAKRLDPGPQKQLIELDPKLAVESGWPPEQFTYDPGAPALSATRPRVRHGANPSEDSDPAAAPAPQNRRAGSPGRRRRARLLLGCAALVGLVALAAPWWVDLLPAQAPGSPPTSQPIAEEPNAAPEGVPDPSPSAPIPPSSGSPDTPPETPLTQPLEIATTPPAATVFVDGELRGLTPTSIELLPGRHRLVIEAEGRKLLRREVDVPAFGRSISIPLVARPHLPLAAGRGGFLRVRCKTLGELRLYVDGMDSGSECPNRARFPIAPGLHRIGLFDPRTGKTTNVTRNVVPSESLSTIVFIHL